MFIGHLFKLYNNLLQARNLFLVKFVLYKSFRDEIGNYINKLNINLNINKKS